MTDSLAVFLPETKEAKPVPACSCHALRNQAQGQVRLTLILEAGPPARSLRSCAPHTLVSAPSRQVVDADRAPGTALVRRTHPCARSGVVPAAADPHHRPIPPLASAPAHSGLLGPSPASARQCAETDTRNSKTVTPLRTAPDSVPGVLSSSACANSRFPSRVLRP